MHIINGVVTGLTGRMAGPGGLYNLGIALGLCAGLAKHVSTSMARDTSGLQVGLAAAWRYLAGSPGATAITLAMLIFFWSGEHYRAAWIRGPHPTPP